ncbi:MAG TPA: hypothetical protein VMX16_10000 [Terriglobia bacterium]|nr:hypothetical protein [Terriglobia bacterium]
MAMGMEGKFSAEGLQAAGEDDDLLMAMARELVTEKGIGENAELVWRAIQHQHSALAHAVPAIIEAESEPEMLPDTLLPAQEPLPAAVNQLLLFGVSLATSSGRKRAVRRTAPSVSFASDQLPLF